MVTALFSDVDLNPILLRIVVQRLENPSISPKN